MKNRFATCYGWQKNLTATFSHDVNDFINNSQINNDFKLVSELNHKVINYSLEIGYKLVTYIRPHPLNPF